MRLERLFRKEEKIQSLTLNPSGLFVTRKGRILRAVFQESFHVISKLARKNLEWCWGSVGEGKGWIYFLSIFRSFLESSCDLVEAASSPGCVTKQRMRFLFSPQLYFFIFNWLTIALQYWFDFCHTSTWICSRLIFRLGGQLRLISWDAWFLSDLSNGFQQRKGLVKVPWKTMWVWETRQTAGGLCLQDGHHHPPWGQSVPVYCTGEEAVLWEGMRTDCLCSWMCTCEEDLAW